MQYKNYKENVYGVKTILNNKLTKKVTFLKRLQNNNKVIFECDVFLLVTQAYSDKVKKNPSAPNRSRTYDLPISTSDALPLSYRRLVVARPLN